MPYRGQILISAHVIDCWVKGTDEDRRVIERVHTEIDWHMLEVMLIARIAKPLAESGGSLHYPYKNGDDYWEVEISVKKK